jgi:GNAT superfamily N-acetyltransferase
MFREARPEEADRLSELALHSKAHWGYSPEFMEACREDLAVSSERCNAGLVGVVADGERLLGFYALAGEAPDGELDQLFVDPTAMGDGLGRQLLATAAEHALELGMRSLRIEADPHAEDFYRHMGALKVGTVPSTSIPGRELPLLTLDLDGPIAPTESAS